MRQGPWAAHPNGRARGRAANAARGSHGLNLCRHFIICHRALGSLRVEHGVEPPRDVLARSEAVPRVVPHLLQLELMAA